MPLDAGDVASSRKYPNIEAKVHVTTVDYAITHSDIRKSVVENYRSNYNNNTNSTNNKNPLSLKIRNNNENILPTGKNKYITDDNNVKKERKSKRSTNNRIHIDESTPEKDKLNEKTWLLNKHVRKSIYDTVNDGVFGDNFNLKEG